MADTMKSVLEIALEKEFERGRQLGMEQARATLVYQIESEMVNFADRASNFVPDCQVVSVESIHATMGTRPEQARAELAKTSKAVAEVSSSWNDDEGISLIKRLSGERLPVGTKLFAAPPATERRPLTELRINQIAAANEVFQYHPGAILEFARDIELAHGIGQQAKEQT